MFLGYESKSDPITGSLQAGLAGPGAWGLYSAGASAGLSNFCGMIFGFGATFSTVGSNYIYDKFKERNNAEKTIVENNCVDD
ncbi:hypothetical protein [Pseudobutyrivibrio xylanivorans]|uniref:Uncharacterized protein n=1 Tax=Pseudobutyrivibrio xylanivorans TaxID=185007 RepID=A0A1G5RZR4_PSEXY|nr:hypothetical protein [Pseudobutyrivibrio xylanivorans]SCZ79503.1 hypothetical protein SAMN02910350_01805 [Pseudobutyrivibrio xylanivorans]